MKRPKVTRPSPTSVKVSIESPDAPLKPVRGGNRKLLSRNGHGPKSRGNIESV